jgi:ABC-2 type transport system permease protein
VLLQLINIIMGVGFGMLLMNSALAIVLYFVLPTVWTVLVSMISALAKPAQWLDLGAATAPLYEPAGLTEAAGARLATAVGIWVILPLAAGLVRLIRREIA